ncbi:TerC family protein [Paenibacillus melissococcoides]|uniref:TerC family protein n=1 Tax=Paenibacillus melissococcoides TaxID=2912268 RepID=A0ABM9G1M0_9BACL|nr:MULTISPECIES: TerC family protein [Paenibacillus]MEB9892401.1 TerC family protein [Bacillus cereus]CAH8245395.1 TerC family protein [Paenibacillus melissococcoides]CAH8710817.1 TerC family protein [Paenibacillus melissococcoides]CAH8711619.1 TerC family protein [Paenibacillus melissococcoides]GIO77706.1 membrane protein [Paenibacillus dendritiformis]
MELFSIEFWTALLSIVVIDLVLAGDNAIVIGLAARNVPKQDQKKVIILGTGGAIVIRAIATLLVVYLLMVPGLQLFGGLLLLWIAVKLMIEEKEHNIKAGTSIGAAVGTIIVADAAMGLDNVLAVAGAAKGHPFLVILGLMISLPIVVWGSTIVLKFIEKYPVIIVLGSAVLAWTASKMLVAEKFVAPYFANPFIKYGFEAIVVLGALATGILLKRKRAQRAQEADDHAELHHHRAQGE